MKTTNVFGLSPRQFIELMSVLNKNRECLSQVILFGSRARGDYIQTSDINLVIEYKGDVTAQLTQIVSGVSLHAKFV